MLQTPTSIWISITVRSTVPCSAILPTTTSGLASARRRSTTAVLKTARNSPAWTAARAASHGSGRNRIPIRPAPAATTTWVRSRPHSSSRTPTWQSLRLPLQPHSSTAPAVDLFAAGRGDLQSVVGERRHHDGNQRSRTGPERDVSGHRQPGESGHRPGIRVHRDRDRVFIQSGYQSLEQRSAGRDSYRRVRRRLRKHALSTSLQHSRKLERGNADLLTRWSVYGRRPTGKSFQIVPANRSFHGVSKANPSNDRILSLFPLELRGCYIEIRAWVL